MVGKTGNKRFLFCYTFNGRKQSIGLDINVVTARKIAQKHRVSLSEGTNPKAERDNHQRLTLNEFFNQHYLPSIRKRKKSWDDDKTFVTVESPTSATIKNSNTAVLIRTDF